MKRVGKAALVGDFGQHRAGGTDQSDGLVGFQASDHCRWGFALIILGKFSEAGAGDAAYQAGTDGMRVEAGSGASC